MAPITRSCSRGAAKEEVDIVKRAVADADSEEEAASDQSHRKRFDDLDDLVSHCSAVRSVGSYIL